MTKKHRYTKRCPNCLERVPDWGDHYYSVGFECEFKQPSRRVSADEYTEVQNIRYAYDRVWNSNLWDEQMDEWVAEMYRQNPPAKWWETAMAVVALGPIIVAVFCYGALDEFLRKRGV